MLVSPSAAGAPSQALPQEESSKRILRRVSDEVGREVVEMTAKLASLADGLSGQSNQLVALQSAAGAVVDQTHEISSAARKASDNVGQITGQMDASRARVDDALTDIRALIAGVAGSAAALSSLKQALARVGKVAREIDDIAAQTNLLAPTVVIDESSTTG